jgi:hypothetical protein
MDQALLCNQVGDQVDQFKRAFIRTATDLMAAVNQKSGDVEDVFQSIQEASARAESPNGPITKPMLKNVLTSLKHVPNLVYVREYWKNTQTPQQRAAKLGEVFERYRAQVSPA